MSKYNYGLAGNSSHIHNSLWSADGKTPLFFDKKADWTLSTLGQQWAAGPAEIRQGIHLVPGALHQLLQALPGRHLRADQDHLERGQPHRRLPPVRRGHQGHPHGMPHRRRRPQPLSRLRGADRRRPCRHRREARAAKAFRRRCLSGIAPAGDPEDAARCHRDAGQVEDAESRRSARTCSNTMSTPPNGSSSNTTAALRIGNCTGVSSGTRVAPMSALPHPFRRNGREVRRGTRGSAKPYDFRL